MVKMKIKKSIKNILYICLSSSLITGLLFFIFNEWIVVEGEFGPVKHPYQHRILIFHGLSAFILMMILGSIFTNHIPLGWKTKKLKKAGMILASFASIQIITAFLLYYMSGEARDYVKYLHLIIGTLLPFALIFHIVLGKKTFNKEFKVTTDNKS